MPGKNFSIIDYHPLPNDGRVYNPYLREVMELLDSLRRDGGSDIAASLLERRTALVSKYAFSIPTISALEIIAAHSPLVEIGAGTGYWAMCLTELGADIAACDTRVPGEGSPWDPFSGNPWHDDTWFPVDEGDETTAALHHDRTLLLCWPPPENPMAFNALSAYLRAGGRRLIFVGSVLSSGDAAFHRLRSSMTFTSRVQIPGWPFIEEILSVHEAEDDMAYHPDNMLAF
jgi:hypothetical protein